VPTNGGRRHDRPDQELSEEERLRLEEVERVLLELERKGKVERVRNANGETAWLAKITRH
jgi:hypothetical protein